YRNDSLGKGILAGRLAHGKRCSCPGMVVNHFPRVALCGIVTGKVSANRARGSPGVRQARNWPANRGEGPATGGWCSQKWQRAAEGFSPLRRRFLTGWSRLFGSQRCFHLLAEQAHLHALQPAKTTEVGLRGVPLAGGGCPLDETLA